MSKTWVQELTEREYKEVLLAQFYIQQLNHGTDGHSRLVLIDKLARLLDEAEKKVSDERA